MTIIDLTHTFSIHTPGWVGYPSPKLSYFQRHAKHGIVSQMHSTPERLVSERLRSQRPQRRHAYLLLRSEAALFTGNSGRHHGLSELQINQTYSAESS